MVGSTSPTPQNAAPTLSALAPQRSNQDTATHCAGLHASNDDGGGGGAHGDGHIDNPAIVPGRRHHARQALARIDTIAVSPAEDATGKANITISVKDAQGLQSTAMSFA